MIVPDDKTSPHVNLFVSRLIRLQQDGKEAISGPANWRDPPLLDVATDTDDAVDALLKAMCPSSGQGGPTVADGTGWSVRRETGSRPSSECSLDGC